MPFDIIQIFKWTDALLILLLILKASTESWLLLLHAGLDGLQV